MSALQRQWRIPGSRPSLQNGQLRVSTGNTSIDAIFSGGLPIGSLWLIEEDRYANYSRALQRYFLGEGAVHGHELFVANLDEDPRDFITKIPQPCPEQTAASDAKRSAPPGVEQQPQVPVAVTGDDDLRIAWRYNGLPRVNAEQRTTNAKHSFDLTTCLGADELSALHVSTFGPVADVDGDSCAAAAAPATGFRSPYYGALLRAIRRRLVEQKQQQAASADGGGNLLRICITGLGGPLWYGSELSSDVCRFLVVLRALVRQSAAVCCVSMPSHLFQYHDDRLIYRVRNTVDYALQLESFAGSDRETNPIYVEYHGLLYIRRMVALNTLAAGSPATHDLAFKLRRRQFVVEKLHLPPELQDAADADGASSVGCGSTGSGKSLLEF